MSIRIDEQHLSVAMAKAGMNCTQLADCSGVSRATISNINSGKRCMPNVVSKIARALDVEVEYLVKKC